MIDNTAYVIALIKKQVEGTLSKEEYVEWKLAKLLYDEEAWFRMEVDAFCELEDERPDKEPIDWRPAFRRVRRIERREKLLAAIRKAGPWLGAAALLLLAVWWGGRMLPNRPQSIDPGSDCLVWAADDGEIPLTEFACTVSWGDSTGMAVEGNSGGSLRRIGNIELWRHPDGVLALVPISVASAGEASGTTYIHIATEAGQQCAIQLPDGSLVRLNAGSSLTFPLGDMGVGITYARLMGQAWVQPPKRDKTGLPAALIIKTANGQLQSDAGEYTVSATPWHTKAVLLKGGLTVFGPNGKESRELVYPGDYATLENCCANGDGMITVDVQVGCTDPKQAIEWTKANRRYRNVPLREFVADMARWYGIPIENIDCVPEGPLVTALVCYRAPVDEFYAHLHQSGVFMHRVDGMLSFCEPSMDPLARPVEKGLLAHHAPEGCGHCGEVH